MTTKVAIALELLQKGNVSTTELWTATGWKNRPSRDDLQEIANQKGFTLISKKDEHGVRRHTFVDRRGTAAVDLKVRQLQATLRLIGRLAKKGCAL